MQRVSDEQFNIMIDYMEKYRELYYGKITPAFTAKVKQDLWAELAQKLNSTESGCKRPVEKWIKIWNLWKGNTKLRALTIQKRKGKLRRNSRALSDVQKRCYALITLNDQSGNNDDLFKEITEIEEENYQNETMDDIAKQEMDTIDAEQNFQVYRNNSSSANKNSSTSVLENNQTLEDQQNLDARTEDSTETFSSDDNGQRVNNFIEKSKRSPFPRYSSTSFSRKRLSSLKRMRLTSAKRMRLSASDTLKLSGSRKMKASTSNRIKRRISEKLTKHAINGLQEYMSDSISPRVEIKASDSEKMMKRAIEEIRSPDKDSSKNSREECVIAKHNYESERMVLIDGRIQISKSEKETLSDEVKNNEVDKVAEALSLCLNDSFSEDWRNAIVEKLKGITENVTDTITGKVRDVISDRVQNDISIKLKDTLSKFSSDHITEVANVVPVVPKKEASAEIAKTTQDNEMDTECIENKTDVTSGRIGASDELRKSNKISEVLNLPMVAIEDLKDSERNTNIGSDMKNKFYNSESPGMKKKDNFGILGKSKRSKHESESSSEEELFMFPPSKRRKKYTENVVGELRLLQSSRLERLDSINKALKTNNCSLIILAKTIDNNTEAINKLAKAINNIGSLFLTSFD